MPVAVAHAFGFAIAGKLLQAPRKISGSATHGSSSLPTTRTPSIRSGRRCSRRESNAVWTSESASFFLIYSPISKMIVNKFAVAVRESPFHIDEWPATPGSEVDQWPVSRLT